MFVEIGATGILSLLRTDANARVLEDNVPLDDAKLILTQNKNSLRNLQGGNCAACNCNVHSSVGGESCMCMHRHDSIQCSESR